MASQYPESGVSLVADLTQYTTAMQSAIDLAETWDDLATGDHTFTVSAEVDTSQLSQVEDLPLNDETVNYTVDVTETGDDIENLPQDGETVETNVDVQPSEETSKLMDFVSTIKDAVISTVWNLAGTGLDFIKGVGGDAVGGLFELDTALAKIKATTGEAIPGAKELIQKIFYSDLGDSITQVGNVVAKAQQLKLPLEDASTAALKFTKVFPDNNPEDVLNTLSQIVNNKLEPDFTKAGDFLVEAFQKGANKSGDFLTALDKNATAIKDLGLTGPQALSYITTGLDGGYKSATQVLDTLTKIKQNVTNAAGNSNSDVTKTLNTLGIANPAETGKAWSSDFFNSVIQGIQNAPVSDSEKEAMFANLVGGKQGAKTFSAFLKLSPDQADAIFAEIPGAATRAAADSKDSLSGAFAEFELMIQSKVSDFLTSSAIDLPGKIELLKTGLQSAMDTLAVGGSLSDAFTVALKPLGFDDEFQGLESMLGNFVIALLQIVSSLQSLSPDNWEAKKGTDALITKQGATQLAFDLKIANPDDVATDIATATSRGLSTAQIADTVSSVIDGLIKDGTKDSLAKAQTLIDTLKKPIDMNTVPLLANGTPMNVEPTITPDALAGLQSKLDAANPVTVEAVPSTASTDAFLDNIMPLGDATKTLTTNTTNAAPKVTAVADGTKKQGDNAAAANVPVRALADSTGDLADNARTAAISTSDISDSIDTMSMTAPVAATGLDALNVAIRKIINEANDLSAASAAMKTASANKDADPGKQFATGSGDATGSFLVGEDGPEIVTTNKSLAVLNNLSSSAIMAALNSYIPGSNGGQSSGGNSYTAISYNNVQSQPMADAVGYKQAAMLRGMAQQ